MPDVIKCANVRMVQGRDGARFALETFFGFRICRKVLEQNFDGHGAVEACVPGAIHLAHAARPERRLNLVGAKLCTRGENHECATLYSMDFV